MSNTNLRKAPDRSLRTYLGKKTLKSGSNLVRKKIGTSLLALVDNGRIVDWRVVGKQGEVLFSLAKRGVNDGVLTRRGGICRICGDWGCYDLPGCCCDMPPCQLPLPD
ncbi:MAG: hypothetical protein WEB63_06610 [Cucumibacter sp.]